jgi:hypothetical protein
MIRIVTDTECLFQNGSNAIRFPEYGWEVIARANERKSVSGF